MISCNYSEKISFITFFPIFTNIFTNAPGLQYIVADKKQGHQRLADSTGTLERNGQTNTTDRITFPINAVSNKKAKQYAHHNPTAAWAECSSHFPRPSVHKFVMHGQCDARPKVIFPAAKLPVPKLTACDRTSGFQ